MKDKNDNSTIDMFEIGNKYIPEVIYDPEDRVCVVRMMETPDGVVLHSKHQHDCVVHVDENGVRYQLDGGTIGFGSCYNLDKCKNISLYYGDSHEDVREHFVWGQSFDKDMNRIPFRWAKLKDMSDGHLAAVMDLTKDHVIKKEIHYVIRDEWVYRKDNDVVVECKDD